ncbi:MAG: hypothetical protein H6739_06870 [Alphaproteobacteria bacterium]|nr:hypothetical protein [Alphaproteobacteria bacterium]
MADNMTPEQQRRIMSRIWKRDTKPEMTIRRLAHARGLRYPTHVSSLPGTPDMASIGPRWLYSSTATSGMAGSVRSGSTSCPRTIGAGRSEGTWSAIDRTTPCCRRAARRCCASGSTRSTRIHKRAFGGRRRPFAMRSRSVGRRLHFGPGTTVLPERSAHDAGPGGEP